MILHPLDVAPFTPTPKQPGDIVIHGHASYRVQDDGSWEPLDWPDAPLPYGKYGQNHPIVIWGWVPVLLIAVVMIGAALLSEKGIW